MKSLKGDDPRRTRQGECRSRALFPRATKRVCAAATLVAAVCGVTSAYAQAPGNEARAQTLFEAAKQLRDGGQIADACPMFLESQTLAPGVGVTLYLADCYERLGRTASAWQEFRRAEGIARDRHDDKRADVARARAEGLEPKLRRLTLVGSAGPHEGWQVMVDGSPVPTSMWNAAMALDPGDHVVTVDAPGQPPRLVHTMLDASHPNAAVDIDAVAPGAAPLPVAEPAEATPAEPASRGGGSPVRTWIGVGLVAVGLAGAGLGTDFVIKRNKLINDCTPCDTPQNEDETAAAAAIAFSVGGAALVSALVVFLSAPGPTPSTGNRGGTRSAWTWTPAMWQGGAGAVVLGAF
jgi:hypothetical protein